MVALKELQRLVGVEAAGHGIDTDKHAATMTKGEFGVLHGSASYLLQTEDGQIKQPHSISAGLDYPGVGPEHSYLKSTGRVQRIYYFSKDARSTACDKPAGYNVKENTRTGLPFLTKK